MSFKSRWGRLLTDNRLSVDTAEFSAAAAHGRDLAKKLVLRK